MFSFLRTRILFFITLFISFSIVFDAVPVFAAEGMLDLAAPGEDSCYAFDNPQNYAPPNQGVYLCHSSGANPFGYVDGWDYPLSWAEFEPSEGRFDYTIIDSAISQLKGSGKRGNLLFMNYEVDGHSLGSPDWLREKGVQFVNFGTPAPTGKYYAADDSDGNIPANWDDTYQFYLRRAMVELGNYLRIHDPCKLIDVVQMSLGGYWGGVSIYTTDMDKHKIWLQAYDSAYDPSDPYSITNSTIRRGFASAFSNGIKKTVDSYMAGITDRPVVLINPTGSGLSTKSVDVLPGGYSFDSVSTYGGRVFIKDAGVGNDAPGCGINMVFAQFCNRESGSGGLQCHFGTNCPATRCMFEPFGGFNDFVREDCNYGTNYIGYSMDMDTKEPTWDRGGNSVMSTKGGMNCIYTEDLQDTNLSWVHSMVNDYTGIHFQILNSEVVLASDARSGTAVVDMYVWGNIPAHIFERSGNKDIPASFKIRLFASPKNSNEKINIGYYEPSPPSIVPGSTESNVDWTPGSWNSATLKNFSVAFTVPDYISGGEFELWGAIYDPTHYYHWPLDHTSGVDDFNRFKLGEVLSLEPPATPIEFPTCISEGNNCCDNSSICGDNTPCCLNGLICIQGKCVENPTKTIPSPVPNPIKTPGSDEDPSTSLPINDVIKDWIFISPAINPRNPYEPDDVAIAEEGYMEEIVNVFYRFLGSGTLLLGAFLIALNGYRLLVGSGDPEKVEVARDGLSSAVIGIVFSLLGFAVLIFITTLVTGVSFQPIP